MDPDDLRRLIGAGMAWPPPAAKDRIDVQEGYALLARNRRHEVIQEHSIDLLRYASQEDVVPFPSVRIAARTFAAFLFGEDPTYTHPDEDVAAWVRSWAMRTNLTALLQEAAYTAPVQGEVYLRPTWDVDVSPDPIPTAIPGSRVIPAFRHGVLVGASVVTTYEKSAGHGLSGAAVTIYRLVERYTRGSIERDLYRGTDRAMGEQVALDTIPETEGLEEVVSTGIDHVGLVHVPHARPDLSSPHGVSLFDGLEGLVIALHRLYSQDQHDAEMSRRRVAVSEEFLRRDGAGNPMMDRRLDLFVLTDDAAGAVGNERAPITAIEFDDDLIMSDRIARRFRDFLIACGIAPDTIEAQDAGQAISGTSRRLAQAMTIQTVTAAGRYWRSALSEFVGLALDVAAGPLGQTVPPTVDPVQVELADGFVDDPVEEAQTIATLDTAEAISTEQKVRRLHPDWDDEQVADEVTAIGGVQAPPVPPTGVPAGIEDLRGVLSRRGADGNGQG